MPIAMDTILSVADFDPHSFCYETRQQSLLLLSAVMDVFSGIMLSFLGAALISESAGYSVETKFACEVFNRRAARISAVAMVGLGTTELALLHHARAICH